MFSSPLFTNYPNKLQLPPKIIVFLKLCCCHLTSKTLPTLITTNENTSRYRFMSDIVNRYGSERVKYKEYSIVDFFVTVLIKTKQFWSYTKCH